MNESLGDQKTLDGGKAVGSSATLDPGIVLGQYRIIRLLGRGGMGEVYEAEHQVLRRRYALKLLPTTLDWRGVGLERFQREAQVMANLDHRNILRVDDFGETNGRYWLRMELAEGVNRSRLQVAGSKSERMVSLQNLADARGGKVPQNELLDILKQILAGLEYAHVHGAIHRDLKPANILLFPNPQSPNSPLIKIADFGLVRLVGEEWVRSQAQLSVQHSMSIGDQATLGKAESEGTSTRSLLGTYEYMSPEQKRGEEADARSDLYAVGLITFRLLTGRNPGTKPPSKIDPALASAWDDMVESALEENPHERSANGDVLRRQLMKVADQLDARQKALKQRDQEIARVETARHSAEPWRPTAEKVARARAAKIKRTTNIDKAAHSNTARTILVLSFAAAVGFAGWVGWTLERDRQIEARIKAQNAAQRRESEARLREATVRSMPDSVKRISSNLATTPNQTAKASAQALDFAAVVRKAQPAEAPRPCPNLSSPWTNSLGMRFNPVAGLEGILFSIWETREKDYSSFIQATGRSWANYNWKGKDAELPALDVSWNDANHFAEWLTKKERASGLIGLDWEYRLPTDAEWSAAVGLSEASAGSPKEKGEVLRDVFPWNSGRGHWPPPPGAGSYGETLYDEYSEIAPVGSFAPNANGLCDLGGNVREWCEDYSDGPDIGGRVVRGASWIYSDQYSLRSAWRQNQDPDAVNLDLGFRVVLGSTR